MKPKLIYFLVCPKCKGQLEQQINKEDKNLPWTEIIEGALICYNCGGNYRIRNGIPRMKLNPLSGKVQKTVDDFGWEWTHFNEQIQNTFMTDKALFLDFIYPVTEEFFKDKIVLDAGCGMGRFMKMGAEFGSKEIIGVDLSSSVDVAYKNTRHLPNAHVIQADIMSLPFNRQFDYIFSIGVLHHMENPKAGFKKLSELLKKNGQISAWVYSRENNEWIIHLISPLRKYITSRLPSPILYILSKILGLFLFACLKLIYKPVNDSRLELKLRRLLPYNDYLYYSSRLSYASMVSVIFDHLSPKLAAYISRDEFEEWFRDGNLSAVTITSRNKMSWRGRGRRSESFKVA